MLIIALMFMRGHHRIIIGILVWVRIWLCQHFCLFSARAPGSLHELLPSSVLAFARGPLSRSLTWPLFGCASGSLLFDSFGPLY